MKIICLNGKSYDVKYIHSKEKITNDFGTSSNNYPNFKGSKNYHNSTSSDKFTLTFAIHKSLLIGLKESLKVIADPDNLVVDPIYKKLEHIVIEHPDFGAVKGNILGSITYDTSGIADTICSCVFGEHTEDNSIEKKDIENENETAVDGIDSETSSNFDVDLSVIDKSALSKCADRLNTLYSNIKNSSVVSAFNDLDSLINSTTLDSLAIMNAFKNIISLPNEVLPDLDSKITMLQDQATAIKDTPVSSYNLALFNANALSYNVGISSRTPFISEAALESAAGIKSVSMS